MAYDSTADTVDHINKVAENIGTVVGNLQNRAFIHDMSKLSEPEKSAYDWVAPKLKDSVYGSEEYRATLREIEPAIKHHYSVNPHHPEHFENGINGMSLMAIMEMTCDWRAAAQRHDPPTSFEKSLSINIERFKISDQLASVIRNTASELGWS